MPAYLGMVRIAQMFSCLGIYFQPNNELKGDLSGLNIPGRKSVLNECPISTPFENDALSGILADVPFFRQLAFGIGPGTIPQVFRLEVPILRNPCLPPIHTRPTHRASTGDEQ